MQSGWNKPGQGPPNNQNQGQRGNNMKQGPGFGFDKIS